MTTNSTTQTFRVFMATWNVGGKPPHSDLNLNDFLKVEDQSDIYVLGLIHLSLYQNKENLMWQIFGSCVADLWFLPFFSYNQHEERNVLVIEDDDPAVKWLSLINDALNKPLLSKKFQCPNNQTEYSTSFSCPVSRKKKSLVSRDLKTTNSLLFFQKPSHKTVRRSFRIVRGRQLESYNCVPSLDRKNSRESCFICQETDEANSSSDEDEGSSNVVVTDLTPSSSTNQLKYSLIASKQMVGIFVTVWVQRELVPHIGHLKLSCIGRGILGYLGNKGCISIRFSSHQTTFCFMCSHLASGEKEGDELKRNSDVIEILKSTQFPRNCKVPGRRIPDKILEHDRVIWLGDLNYRIALSYSETQKLLEKKMWNALLEKDQLKIEREAGRAFNGWKEGKIEFPPTYKYSDNSDAYTGDALTSKNKRRTPAWCDRVLWHGNGIEQLYYAHREFRFSDHRPVCAAFMVEVRVDGRIHRGLPIAYES